MTELIGKEVTVLGVGTFWTNRSFKYNFLGIYEIFNITISTNLDCRMWFQYGIIIFGYSNFNIDNYSFCSSCEIVVSKNVKQLLNKLASKFDRTVHRFHARVESPTCTIYVKYLRESIMAVLTPKSEIKLRQSIITISR